MIASLRKNLERRVYEALSTRVRPSELAALATVALGIRRRPHVVDGKTFFIDPVSNFGFRLYRDGFYEPETTMALEECLHADDTFVDLGANEGYFSVLASSRVGPGGSVFAIEPQSRCWPIIIQNILDNDCQNVKLLPFGIAAERGALEIVLTPTTNTGGSSFVSTGRALFWPRQRVHVMSLREVFTRYAIGKVALMKVDIEGYELVALESGKEVLATGQIENLLVEVHPRQLRELGRNPAEVEQLLTSFGYVRSTSHPDLFGRAA